MAETEARRRREPSAAHAAAGAEDFLQAGAAIAREARQQFFRVSVAEVFVVIARAHVDERQNRDRSLRTCAYPR